MGKQGFTNLLLPLTCKYQSHRPHGPKGRSPKSARVGTPMTSKPINRFILPVLTAVTLLASCSSAITDTEEFGKLNESKLQEAKAFVSKVKFKVSAVPVNGQPLRNTFKVTLTDLQTISADKQVTRNATPTVNSIEPVIYNNDTIMYLVNYQKGWRLYSVDKRMPTILAENLVETGKKATDILNNKGIRFWVADIAGQTAYLSQTDEYDENSENLQQWSGQSRGIKRIPIQPVPGEYIYVGREEVSRTTVYQPKLFGMAITHLIHIALLSLPIATIGAMLDV